MNQEKILNSNVIKTGDFDSVLSYGLTEDYFYLPEEKNVFRIIYEHVIQHGSVPSKELLKSLIPSYQISPTSDSVESVVEMVMSNKVRVEAISAAKKLANLGQANYRDYIKLLQETSAGIASLAPRRGGLRSFSDDIRLVKDAYSKGFHGVPYPWPTPNRSTLGMCPQEITLFYARPGQMKTWVLCKIAAHLIQQEIDFTLFSYEMSVQSIMNRIAISFCGLDYDKFRHQKFSPEDLCKFEFGLRKIEQSNGNNFIIVDQEVIGPYADGTIPILNTYKPQVVLLDGVYLMSDAESKRPGTDWIGLKGIMRSIKDLSKSYSLPYVITSQRTREGETSGKMADNTLADIAYGDILGQYADVVFRLKLEEDLAHIKVFNPKVRESRGEVFYINAFPGLNMSEKTVDEEMFL